MEMNEGYAVVTGGKLRHIPRHDHDSALSARRSAPGTVFGLHLSSLSSKQIAAMVLSAPRALEQGVGIIATANIQHISQMRRNLDFTEAMMNADLVTCDGFPVFRYASFRGIDVRCRTTGRDIVHSLMTEMPISEGQRLFFVVDSEETGQALSAWASAKGIEAQVKYEVPPPRFISSEEYCEALARRISDYGTTVLLFCVGAPQSEVYAHRYRSLLPACWALCVGQSAKIVLGLSPTPPQWVESLNVEWLWRIWLEPRRLSSRYMSSAIGFLSAVLEDQKIAANKAV
jgi:N-acetylglucosaminyldiphosphoundecaprenol N-acetyl-beta-D-mannosaminyltransferase